jgi:hypothetical protein
MHWLLSSDFDVPAHTGFGAGSEGKDASGAEAFQENGEIALSEGKEHQAKGYLQAALREIAGIEADQSGRRPGISPPRHARPTPPTLFSVSRSLPESRKGQLEN